jgi:phosphoribosyl-AMP cyclohydrolase
MSKETKSEPVVLDLDKATDDPSAVTPDWEKILYSPDRVEKWLKGEISGQQLHAITGPEML